MKYATSTVSPDYVLKHLMPMQRRALVALSHGAVDVPSVALAGLWMRGLYANDKLTPMGLHVAQLAQAEIDAAVAAHPSSLDAQTQPVGYSSGMANAQATMTLQDVNNLTAESFAVAKNAATLSDALELLGFQRCGCGGVGTAFLAKARQLGATGAWTQK